MENRKSDNSLQQSLIDNFQKITTTSIDAMQPFVNTMFENLANANKSIAKGNIPIFNLASQNKKGSSCCPPQEECPPHCIANITRQAMVGERIIVPILVTNNCTTTKNYKVGARELKDMDGQMAPVQPTLNKFEIKLEPGRSERVLMTLDLANFNRDTIFYTEVVLREKEYNQNICFTLHVNENRATEVFPYDEKKYKMKWLNWQSHFYCEPTELKSQVAGVRPLERS